MRLVTSVIACSIMDTSSFILQFNFFWGVHIWVIITVESDSMTTLFSFFLDCELNSFVVDPKNLLRESGSLLYVESTTGCFSIHPTYYLSILVSCDYSHSVILYLGIPRNIAVDFDDALVQQLPSDFWCITM